MRQLSSTTLGLLLGGLMPWLRVYSRLGLVFALLRVALLFPMALLRPIPSSSSKVPIEFSSSSMTMGLLQLPPIVKPPKRTCPASSRPSSGIPRFAGISPGIRCDLGESGGESGVSLLEGRPNGRNGSGISNTMACISLISAESRRRAQRGAWTFSLNGE